ncbi:hypothetical protein B7R21_06455 [Subtercola boreus]|uniref:Uncharacterized protein n=1 Tax=Subtercola boreus TaxID=120213 RepID=A0A3E0VXA4_9MICO|nr:hypothetical protein [Subtercola boreus]RFA14235.1 hypothetical protein B7R21_06455 [Subtercola boreus]
MTAQDKPLLIQSDALGAVISMDAMSFLCGVTEAEYRAEFDMQRLVAGGADKFSMSMPPDWMKSARRNYAEASASINSSDLQKVVAHLKQKRDGGAAFRRESE